MGKILNITTGAYVEFALTDEQREAGRVRGEERRRQRAWTQIKSEAQAALAATDYLAMPDRRPMTDAETTYREALREIVRTDPVGTAPALPRP